MCQRKGSRVCVCVCVRSWDGVVRVAPRVCVLSGSVRGWNWACRRGKEAEQVCLAPCVVAHVDAWELGGPCRSSVPLPGLEASSAEKARERFAPSPWPELPAHRPSFPGTRVEQS